MHGSGLYCDAADKVGLPSPTPYVDMDDNSIATGVNFALGGSGVTYALGVLPLGTQLDNFEVLLRKGIYSDSFLADSITLVSNSGNDYNANYSNQVGPPVDVCCALLASVTIEFFSTWERVHF